MIKIYIIKLNITILYLDYTMHLHAKVLKFDISHNQFRWSRNTVMVIFNFHIIIYAMYCKPTMTSKVVHAILTYSSRGMSGIIIYFIHNFAFLSYPFGSIFKIGKGSVRAIFTVRGIVIVFENGAIIAKWIEAGVAILVKVIYTREFNVFKTYLGLNSEFHFSFQGNLYSVSIWHAFCGVIVISTAWPWRNFYIVVN